MGRRTEAARSESYTTAALIVVTILYVLGFFVIGIWSLVVNSIANVLLVYSNLAFLIPALQAVKLNRWTMAAVYVLMILASSFYHACTNWTGSCVLQASTLCKTDFFFAQLLIIMTALYIIQFTPHWAFLERWLIIAAAAALYVVEVTMNEPFAAQIIIAGIAFALIVAYWIGYACTARSRPGHRSFPPYDWEAFALGVGLTALACVLFATQIAWHLGYPWVHETWHTLAALGQFWILCTRKAAPRDAAMDARVVGDRNEIF
jgi:hypothetical protein